MESKLKAAAQDSVGELPNLLLREGGYPHLPTTPIKQAPELTDWISGDLKPTIDGIYERDLSDYYGEKVFSYAWFKNGLWYRGYRSTAHDAINQASRIYSLSSYQSFPWRGLAKNPEVQS